MKTPAFFVTDEQIPIYLFQMLKATLRPLLRYVQIVSPK